MTSYGLIRQGTGNAVLNAIPVPTLRDDYILVRTRAIALNPTDWTTFDAKGDDGTIVGYDYFGIVETVGPAVKKPFRKGDRICGFAHGGNDANSQNGAFAKYIAVKGDLQLHIPDDVSFETAASVGVGVASSFYALYHILKLPMPTKQSSEANESILIYGGSTATGTMAIQFAKSGCRVVTTCSSKHFELMRDRGADEVFDYRSPGVGEQIHAATNGQLRLVLDTVSVNSSAAICAKAIGSSGGIYCNLLGTKLLRGDVESIFFLGYDVSGESYIFEGDHYEANPAAFEFASKAFGIAEKLWAQGKWKAHPQRVESGGLLGAIHGMQQMREGKGPSGEKIVYVVDETEWPAPE